MKKGIICTGLLLSMVATVQAQDKQVVDSIANTLESRGLLTPKGSFELEPSISYSQNTSNRISILGYSVLPALVVGLIEAEDADQATFTAALAGRYGLTNRIELELRVPWVYRYDTITKREVNVGQGGAQRFSSEGAALGDIEGAIRYQWNLESAPFWIGSVRFKSDTGESPFDNELNTQGIFKDPPTGSGSWSIEPSMTLIYPTDPAVLFGTAGYTWNLGDDAKRDLDENPSNNPDKFNLGNSFFLGMGMGFAVNDRLSFSLGVNHRTVFKSSINGNKVGEMLQIDSLSTGFGLALTERTSLNMNLQAGLTEDAPDVEVSFSLPISF
ncbi:transporter [Oceanimonas marisflavi]|uniref:transporter n=1 Tax=Oceanimonas marisflavi TaxID=2059724 RepID=UPI000D2F4AA9|nr:transporter [Oceanimonas marisflavi]